MLLATAGKLLQGVRGLLGYVSLTATLLSGLALLLKRSFAEAALTVLAEWVGPFADIIDYARRIVAVWDAWVVHPIHAALASRLDLHLPIWAIEVATLVIFATGPAIRAVWTARASRRRIRDRLNRLDALKDELSRQTGELQALQRQKQALQNAVDNKDRNRFKSALTMAGSVAVGAMDVVNIINGAPLGRGAATMQMAIRSWQAGKRDWGLVESQIESLDRAHQAQAAAVAAMGGRIETMEAADQGLLRGLDDVSPAVADQAIRAFVARQMRIPVALSRFALAFAGAVVAAYAVDAFLPRL